MDIRRITGPEALAILGIGVAIILAAPAESNTYSKLMMAVGIFIGFIGIFLYIKILINPNNNEESRDLPEFEVGEDSEINIMNFSSDNDRRFYKSGNKSKSNIQNVNLTGKKNNLKSSLLYFIIAILFLFLILYFNGYFEYIFNVIKRKVS